jgi:hypothetical protein
MDAQSTSEIPYPDNHDELAYSLEVGYFLDALERVVVRLFGTADQRNDNEDDPSTTAEEA